MGGVHEMSQFDFKQYQQALFGFLTYLDSLREPKSLVAEHLRFPEHESTPLVSSATGRDLWEEVSAKALLKELLKDDDLSSWFGPQQGIAPESNLIELRGHLASFVASWGESSATVEEFVRGWAASLLQILKDPEPACSRVRILFGVEVNQRIEYPNGIAIEPASVEALQRFLKRTGGTERDVLRIPRRPAVFVLTASQVGRNFSGPFAATDAYAWSDTMAENTRWDIWLATGVLPRLGDSYVSGLSRFPAHPAERLPASGRETHSQASDDGSALLKPEHVLKIAKLMESLRGDEPSLPRESVAPLWVANTFIHPAIDTPDALMTLLLGYAGCEGLLLRREDDRTRFGPRLATLIGADVKERRRIQKVAAKWTEIRGDAAHGQRPPIQTIGAYLERPVSAQEATGLWFHTTELTRSARSRAGQLLRRLFLAALFCCVEVDADGILKVGLSRDELVGLLEEALAGNGSAQAIIDGRVPDFVREASF